MEHKTRTKALSWLLSLALVLGFTLPVSAEAADVSYQEASWDSTAKEVKYTEKTHPRLSSPQAPQRGARARMLFRRAA